MTQTFLDQPEDMAWIAMTHLKAHDIRSFGSAVIVGNEDCPAKIQLYASNDPLYSDGFVEFKLGDEGDYIKEQAT